MKKREYEELVAKEAPTMLVVESCQFSPACCNLSISCNKLDNFIKLQQGCLDQVCCNLSFADLLQLVETTWSSRRLWTTRFDSQLANYKQLKNLLYRQTVLNHQVITIFQQVILNLVCTFFIIQRFKYTLQDVLFK